MHGVYTGFQWQCVEYARRYLLLRKSCTFADVRNACNIWTEIRHVERITDGKEFPLRPVANGSSEPPKKDSLLIYVRSRKMPFGHVAVITNVEDDHVYIAEQNNLFNYWPGDYARRVPLRHRDGLYYIDDEDKLFGWMEIEDNGALKPFEETEKEKILAKYLQPQSEQTEEWKINSDLFLLRMNWQHREFQIKEKSGRQSMGNRLEKYIQYPEGLPPFVHPSLSIEELDEGREMRKYERI